MRAEEATVVILAPPGPVRDGLVALVSAIHGLAVVMQTDELDRALDLMRAAGPDLIILDSALGRPELATVVDRLRETAPRSPRLVLVDDVAQVKSSEPTEIVLLKGAPAADLVAAIQSLLGWR
jgi:DNA-binding NarL/FixJ family response regulator